MMFDQLCIAVHLAQNPTSFERSNWETQKHIERLQQYFSMWTNIKQGGILKTKRLSQEINWTFYLLNRCKSNNLHINVMFLLCFIKKTLIYIDHERLGFVKEKSGISLVAGDSGFLLSFLLRLYLLLFLCEIYKLLDLHIKLFHAILDIYIYMYVTFIIWCLLLMKFQFIVMAVYNFLSAAKYGLNLGYVNVQTMGGTSPKWKKMMSVG